MRRWVRWAAPCWCRSSPRILDEITALGDLRAYLPTHYARAYLNFFSQEVNWSEVANGALSAVAYGAIFTALAVWRFTRKDITN